MRFINAVSCEWGISTREIYRTTVDIDVAT